MKLQFLGAAQSVTGSMHLLTVNSSKILLECGLFQGRRDEARRRNRNLPFDAKDIDAMVLSHAHIDHSGNIPNLVKEGFTGNIYCTFGTRDLCSYMLRDSGHIQESDARYLNKRRRRKGQSLIEPIYTQQDATASLESFMSMNYGRQMWIGPDVQLTFYDAGHILGSAQVALDIREDGRKFRLLFSGDIGRPEMPILCDPAVVTDVDYLITESTYGIRYHGTIGDAERALERIVNETHARGGKLIIPSFSVGRTQEIVYALHRLSSAGQIPRLPIYVDSPLSTNATEVFRLHPGYFDEETREFMSEHRDPFGFSNLRYLRHVEDSKALNERDEPMVIISASGMCEAGRILHHLKNNIENPRNTVLFVGFQAEHTLGRKILDGDAEVPIFGDRWQVRARIERIDGYSAHADRGELLDYTYAIGPKRLKRAFVVHGDKDATEGYAEALRDLGVRQVEVPTRGETFVI